MIYFKKVVGCLILLLINFSLLNAQGGKFSLETEKKIKDHIIQTEAQKNKLSSNERKIESNLRSIIKKINNDKEKGILSANVMNKKYSSTKIKN